jgi:hypothetical protein
MGFGSPGDEDPGCEEGVLLVAVDDLEVENSGFRVAV